MNRVPALRLLMVAVPLLAAAAPIHGQRAVGTGIGGGFATSAGGNFQIRSVISHGVLGRAGSNDVAADIGFWFVNDALDARSPVGSESDDRMLAGLPESLALDAPYPNPSPGAARVRFGLPIDGAVRIAVFDALGRLVRVLPGERKAAGWHEAGIATTGLPNGTYFVRLELDGQERVRPLVVLR